MRVWQKGFMGNASNRIYFQLVPSDAAEQAHEFDCTPPPGDPEYRAVFQLATSKKQDKHLMFDASLQRDLPRSLQRGSRMVASLTEWVQGFSASQKRGRIINSLSTYLNFAKRLKFASDGEEDDRTHTDEETDYFVDTWVDIAKRTELRYWAWKHSDGRIVPSDPPGSEDRLTSWRAKPDQEECVYWMEQNRPSPLALATAKQAYEAIKALGEKKLVYIQQPATVQTTERIVMTGVITDPMGNRSSYGSELDTRFGPTLFRKTPGRQRTYGDVNQELSNRLTHLPRRWAMCKFVSSEDDSPPGEMVMKTTNLPDDNPKWENNWSNIEQRSWRDYTRSVEEVEAEVRMRDQTMRQAVEGLAPGGSAFTEAIRGGRRGSGSSAG